MDNNNKIMDSYPLWTPHWINTHMNKFRVLINEKYKLNLAHYWDLYNWSLKQYPQFWEEFFHYANIIYSQPYKEVVDKAEKIEDVPVWFKGAHLNYAENLLRHKDDDRVALYIAGERRQEIGIVTFKQLYSRVSQYAAALKKLNVVKGDRVAGYLPNGEEAVEAMLAVASIGAVWSCTSPDFGVMGVLDRFQQIKPKVIFSVDQVSYNGKIFNHLEKLRQVVKGLPELKAAVIVPMLNESLDKDISDIPNSCYLSQFLKNGLSPDNSIPPLEFVQLPFNHPLFILYSSGTTGPPKCLVHSAGGTLIQHLKEHMLHGNLTKKDTIMYYTTTGWMMWNWLITSLAVGASNVLYEGSPFVPHPAAIWDLVDNLHITILGTSAKWLAVQEAKGIKPRITHNLQSLHTILSTGSPLKPHSYLYVYKDIKSDVLLGSISGGSDIISCFVGQNCSLPVHTGEIQSPNLGMAVECWNEAGESVLGQKGELVCTLPFPCMPIYFWNDPAKEKYRKTYFMKYPGVWNHGDFCVINRITKGILMLGRSDGTLNPNGIRFGSAEIYNIVECFKEIQDSVCVPQYSENNEERVILFLKLADGHSLSNALISKVQLAIKKELSARHVPAVILQIKDIPYTISGKKVEILVKKIIAGEEVFNISSLANPESLDLYYNIPELQTF